MLCIFFYLCLQYPNSFLPLFPSAVVMRGAIFKISTFVNEYGIHGFSFTFFNKLVDASDVFFNTFIAPEDYWQLLLLDIKSLMRWLILEFGGDSMP